MAQGDPFSAFLDFVEAQAQVSITTPTGFITDGSSKRRFLWSRLAQGEGTQVKRVQSGQYIEYTTILSPRTSGEQYQSGAIAAPNNTQHVTKGSAQWRKNRFHMMWNRDELSYNGSTPLTQQWVDMYARQRALLEQDIHDYLEDQLFAVPYKNLMEGSGDDAIAPYSLFAHINEDASGLFGENWTGNTWTVKQGIDPTTTAYGNNAKPQTQTYAGYTTWGAADNLLSGMRQLARKIYWETPATMAEYWENDTLNKFVILTDEAGQENYQHYLQLSPGGDMHVTAAGRQDGGGLDPLFKGVPVIYNDTYGDAAVYDDGSNGLAVQGSADLTGPRYMFINGNYLCPVIKSDEFLRQDGPLRDSRVPDNWVTYVTLHHNLVCTSWKRQGILSPSQDL